jgi:RNA polymerase sigma-70 factor (ECF subfamily)
MAAPSQNRTTELLLHRPRRATAADELMEIVYGDLRRLAATYVRRERSGHTLSATALVHEAYERLVDQTRIDWQGRTHFFAVAAQAMRRILVDHARRRARAKRGGGWHQVALEPLAAPGMAGDLSPEDLLAFEESLVRLAAIDGRQAQVVELRVYGGMTVEEVAAVLGVSKRSVDRDWTHAQSWLRRELASLDEGAPRGHRD